MQVLCTVASVLKQPRVSDLGRPGKLITPNKLLSFPHVSWTTHYISSYISYISSVVKVEFERWWSS